MARIQYDSNALLLVMLQSSGRAHCQFRDSVFPGLGRDGLLRISRITGSNETMTTLAVTDAIIAAGEREEAAANGRQLQ
jgi:hypothetical protein